MLRPDSTDKAYVDEPGHIKVTVCIILYYIIRLAAAAGQAAPGRERCGRRGREEEEEEEEEEGEKEGRIPTVSPPPFQR